MQQSIIVKPRAICDICQMITSVTVIPSGQYCSTCLPGLCAPGNHPPKSVYGKFLELRVMPTLTASIILDDQWLDKGFNIHEMKDGQIVLRQFWTVQHTFEGYVDSKRANDMAEEIWNRG